MIEVRYKDFIICPVPRKLEDGSGWDIRTASTRDRVRRDVDAVLGVACVPLESERGSDRRLHYQWQKTIEQRRKRLRSWLGNE